MAAPIRSLVALLLLLPRAEATQGAASGAAPEWETITPTKATSAGGATLAIAPDGSVLVSGANPATDTITVEALVMRRGITGVRLEALVDPACGGVGPGRTPNGNFVLSELSLEEQATNTEKWNRVALEHPTADFEQAGFGVVTALDGLPNTGWAVAPQFIDHVAVFESTRDLGYEAGVRLRLTLAFNFGGQHVLGKFRLAGTRSPRPLRAPRDLKELFAARERAPGVIARGIQFLLSEQELDGAWAQEEIAYPHGMTALAGYTLLKCGLKKEHPAVQRALANVLSQPASKTYDAGLELMLLQALEDPALLPRIQETTDRLLSWQGGGWSYPYTQPDLSNTQYAALGLRAAAKAGAKVPQAAWLKLGEEVLLHQEKVRGAYEPAGFGYYANGAAYGSVTTGAVCVLKICESEIEKEGVARATFGGAMKRGLEWLDRHFAADTNPLGDNNWIWYWLYGVERVGGLCGVDELGGRNWYLEGSKHIVASQKPDGSFDGAGGKQPSTCFALLFLAKATAPISGFAVRGENLYGADDPAAAVSLRAAGDTPFTIWVSSFGGEVAKTLCMPGEESLGPRVVGVDFLLPGRPIVADARKEGAKWRYATEPPTGGWERPDFDDSAWTIGPGAFGLTGTAGTVVRSEWKSEQLWLRRSFLRDDAPPQNPSLTIHASRQLPKTRMAEPPPLVCLFDEDAAFITQPFAREAGSTTTIRENDAANGRRSLAVTPPQSHSATLIGTAFAITEKPLPTEYRWLRFAWKKEGGGGIMLQLAQYGAWSDKTRRFFAGNNDVNWAGVQVGKEAPTKWTTVTIDLWKEFGGNGCLTGLAFVAMTKGVACFDAIYLARSPDDFKAIPKEGLEAWTPPAEEIAAAAPPADPGVGPSIEVFVNGTRVYAGDAEFADYTTVPTEVPLAGVLTAGRNLLAVYARRRGIGQSIDVAITDDRLLATAAGNPEKPYGAQRCAAQLTFEQNGAYPIRARVHLKKPAPPGEEGGETIVESAPLTIPIHEAPDPELVEYGSDPARNLIALAGATTSATSSFDANWLSNFAVDNRASHGWLSTDTDRRPALTIELKKPVRADRILITPIQMRGADPDRTTFRVRRVEVLVDQGRGGTFEITLPDDFRKGVALLPKPMVVRRLDVRILDATGVHPTKSALGLGEVELQLRK